MTRWLKVIFLLTFLANMMPLPVAALIRQTTIDGSYHEAYVAAALAEDVTTAYCRNDPINNVDPLGLTWVKEEGKAIPCWYYSGGGVLEEIALSHFANNVIGVLNFAIGSGTAEAAGSMVPGVGETMDVMVLQDPNARWWERHLAAASLALNFYTAGVMPNIGGCLRAGKRATVEGSEYLLRHADEGVNRLGVKVSSGVDLIGTPGRSTTVLGQYSTDLKPVIQKVTGGLKNWVNTGNPGGFNVLNVPDGVFDRWGRDAFWDVFNRPFLDDAIKRGDEIVLATRPTADVLINSAGELTGFGREYRYLLDKGFVYDNATSRMVRR